MPLAESVRHSSLLKRPAIENQPQVIELPVASRPWPSERKPPVRALESDPLMTTEEVAKRLNVSPDWVWDHSSRKKPLLPVIRMSDGTLPSKNAKD